MDESTMGRCLEPFFTTKSVGKGTGLGLATVFGIMQQHRGWVDLESVSGQGTDVSVYLPQSREGGAHLSQPRAEPFSPRHEGAEDGDPPGGTETLLFVDDEAPLRKLIRYVFERLGYEVLLASDGAEALRILEKGSRQVDIVVLDLMMPRLSGKDVLEKILERCPDLPVVLSSGYSTELRAKDLLASGAAAFVAKPYDIDDLVRLLRKILDGEAP
jgi:CheY-like chemotaxis protein